MEKMTKMAVNNVVRIKRTVLFGVLYKKYYMNIPRMEQAMNEYQEKTMAWE